ncbi:MAG TPA: hypothetical protein DCL61_23645 [Cyanobacteria bacterium UBA12227]|nr:hypothetical protein [Cyanobacteria bacterium UBA12227]HAX86333.1 hypothetical protein [Cyanobacteria bacterium UBA11370]HBY76614.1 hypothetical protein [Cyanobacteria bacterium UBA11148]
MCDQSQTDRETRKNWQAALETAIAFPEEPILSITFRRSWNSSARPVWVRCIDKNEYIIKGQQAGRQIINDQIIARLGIAMGAPVGQPQLIEISQELIDIEPDFSYLTAGIAHGTMYIGE